MIKNKSNNSQYGVMEIVIRPQIKNDLDFLGITKEEVEDTINTSENKKIIPSLKRDEILFFNKLKNGSYLLVDALWRNKKVEVRNAFRIFEHLIDEVQSNDPFVLLQALADRFGLYIQVGDQQNKYIYEETIGVDPGTKNINLLKIMNIPPRHTAVSNLEYVERKFGKERFAIVRLAYAIDREKYADYLKERMADLKRD
jgi:hypothetical protein